MARKLSDAEILASIAQEESLALDTQSGELQRQRTEALARYRGEPLGDEQPGRSQVVDMSILDTIEWIMPSLVRIYMGGDEIGKFDAIGPEDEAAAAAETQACNWYLTAKNDTFSQINATLRDALLLKNGYMVAFWKTDNLVVTETYIGKSDEELALLQQDPCIKIVEHTEYPDPYYANALPPPQQPGMPPAPVQPPPVLHDVKIERTKADEYVAVESVPPDEMIVERRHRWTSLMDCSFVQWRRKVTVGQLRAEGFKVRDDVSSYYDFTQEATERARFHENDRYYDQTSDPARKVVQLRDTYMQIDLRGSGTPQLWRLAFIAGEEEFLLKEEADIIPFAAFSPIIYPHSHVGSSVYDLIADLGIIKTTLQRQFLDGVYQQHSNQKVVNVNAGVNLDDLLVTRPGNVIRCEGDPSQAVMPLQIADVTPSVLQGLQYIDELKEQRSGVSKNTVGLDPNTLNKTATGVQMQQAAANQRIELIARTLASGFRDLFLIIHALACKHSTKALQMKLNGKWAMVNPREWATRTDFTISVGMGTGNPEVQMQKIMGMAPMMQQWMALGLAGPQEAYNLSVDFIKAGGWSIPDRFIHPPATDPQTGQPVPPPQQPDPIVQAEQIRAQSAQAIAQGKAQMDMQAKQMDLQANHANEAARAQAAAQAEAARAQADVAIQQHKTETQRQLDLQKFQLQLQADDVRHQREQETQLQLANIKAANALEVARVTRGVDDGVLVLQQELREAYGNAAATIITAMQQMQEQMQAMSGPKEIVRGPDGRAIGIKSANGAMQQVVRGPDGRATGIH